MANKNTSDSIEAYIKALLAQAGMAELKRSELADVFQVVPSQINDILQMLYEEKLLTKRETQLLLATTSDEVLGRDALILRASMLKKIIQQVDRKGNTD